MGMILQLIKRVKKAFIVRLTGALNQHSVYLIMRISIPELNCLTVAINYDFLSEFKAERKLLNAQFLAIMQSIK